MLATFGWFFFARPVRAFFISESAWTNKSSRPARACRRHSGLAGGIERGLRQRALQQLQVLPAQAIRRRTTRGHDM